MSTGVAWAASNSKPCSAVRSNAGLTTSSHGVKQACNRTRPHPLDELVLDLGAAGAGVPGVRQGAGVALVVRLGHLGGSGAGLGVGADGNHTTHMQAEMSQPTLHIE